MAGVIVRFPAVIDPAFTTGLAFTLICQTASTPAPTAQVSWT